MPRSVVLAWLALAFLSPTALARPPEVGLALPGAEQVGEAQYRVFSIPFYSAETWAEGEHFSWNEPFALTLIYHRSAPASFLINRSIHEMSRRGAGAPEQLTPLRVQLARCFPDVAPNDRITGVSTDADTARFYHNAAHRCDVRWPGFRRYFFGIWLAGRGPDAEFSARLRGER